MVYPDICDTPKSPANGSVIAYYSLYPVASEVTYHCDEGLVPTGVMTSTCRDVGGSEKWVPDPGQLMCKKRTGISLLKRLSQHSGSTSV